MKKAMTVSALLAVTSILAMTVASTANALDFNSLYELKTEKDCVQIFLSENVSGGEQLFKAGYSFIDTTARDYENRITPELPENYIIIQSAFLTTHYQKRESLGQIVNFFTAGGLDYTTAQASATMKIKNSKFVIAETKATSRYSEYDSAVAQEESQVAAVKKVISYIKKNKINVCE